MLSNVRIIVSGLLHKKISNLIEVIFDGQQTRFLQVWQLVPYVIFVINANKFQESLDLRAHTRLSHAPLNWWVSL